jgi:transposase-like protein
MASSKKGVSANQIHRTLRVTLKTAWFMAHRLRLAMNHEPGAPFGGIVEIDETYVGGKLRIGSQAVKPGERPKDHPSHTSNKAPVFSLVQRGGSVKSYYMPKVTAKNLRPIIDKIVTKDAHVMTDDSTVLDSAAFDRKHSKVNHKEKEYVRMENGELITTNTIESYFAILKRGINGTYHHCDAKHLHRYLAEFDFRYNNRIAKGVDDLERTDNLLQGVVGKRLTYTTSN